jgi:hypothetical protein
MTWTSHYGSQRAYLQVYRDRKGSNLFVVLFYSTYSFFCLRLFNKTISFALFIYNTKIVIRIIPRSILNIIFLNKIYNSSAYLLFTSKQIALTPALLPKDEDYCILKIFCFNFNFKHGTMSVVYILIGSRIINHVYFNVFYIFPHILWKKSGIFCSEKIYCF